MASGTGSKTQVRLLAQPARPDPAVTNPLGGHQRAPSPGHKPTPGRSGWLVRLRRDLPDRQDCRHLLHVLGTTRSDARQGLEGDGRRRSLECLRLPVLALGERHQLLEGMLLVLLVVVFGVYLEVLL